MPVVYDPHSANRNRNTRMVATQQTTADKIGLNIQQIVAVERELEKLGDMQQGAQHPEMIGQYHDQTRAYREKLAALKEDQYVLKQMHRTELTERISKLEAEKEDTLDAWDVIECDSLINQAKSKIAVIDGELLKLKP